MAAAFAVLLRQIRIGVWVCIFGVHVRVQWSRLTAFCYSFILLLAPSGVAVVLIIPSFGWLYLLFTVFNPKVQ